MSVVSGAAASATTGPTSGPTAASVAGQIAEVAEVVAGADLIENWPIGITALIDRLCASSGDPITQAQWNQYLPGRPYRPPCLPSG